MRFEGAVSPMPESDQSSNSHTVMPPTDQAVQEPSHPMDQEYDPSGPQIQTTAPTPPLQSPAVANVQADGLLAPRSAYWILLAEDNPLNSEIFTKGITRMGFNVLAVPNGQEAVEAVSKRPWDLVLMDGQMPICDGYEATRLIRQNQSPIVSHTTVIALTASAIAGDKERCLEAGMNGYLAKPVRLKVVSFLMHHLMEPRLHDLRPCLF